MGQRSLQVAIGSDEFQQAVAAQGLSAEEVALGDKLLVKTRDGGSTKYFLGSDQLGRDLLSRIFPRRSNLSDSCCDYTGRRWHHWHFRGPGFRLLWRLGR